MGHANKKLSLMALVLMIFTTVFGFTNSMQGFFLMGYASIPCFIAAAILFFIPFAFMVTEYGAAFQKESGGILTWMGRSVNDKYAFIGTFMWYTSYVIWFVNICSGMIMRISVVIFGENTTSSWHLFGFLQPSQSVGVLAILLMLLITYISAKGLNNIAKIASVGGITVLALNVVLIFGALIILISNKGEFAQPITGASFIHATNPSYNSVTGFFAYITMAIFAYGGLEAAGGLVDQTEKPEKNFRKAILIASVVITIGYALATFCIGMYVNWNESLSDPSINMASAQYTFMQVLAYKLALAFGAGEASAKIIGLYMTRFYAAASILMYLGALFSLAYAPLKQLIEGTPAEMWPKKLTEKKNGMPCNAMWLQCAIVVFLLLLTAFGGSNASKFFNMLVLMITVAMTIPYVFIAGAFPSFRRKTEIEKPLIVFKSNRSALVWSVLVVVTVGFANVFTIINPALTGDVTSTVYELLGPILFGAIGYLIYHRYERITKSKKASEFQSVEAQPANKK